MASKTTNAIGNRLGLSLGWLDSKYPTQFNLYSEKIQRWLQLYLAIKEFLNYRQIKVISFRLKHVNSTPFINKRIIQKPANFLKLTSVYFKIADAVKNKTINLPHQQRVKFLKNFILYKKWFTNLMVIKHNVLQKQLTIKQINKSKLKAFALARKLLKNTRNRAQRKAHVLIKYKKILRRKKLLRLLKKKLGTKKGSKKSKFKMKQNKPVKKKKIRGLPKVIYAINAPKIILKKTKLILLKKTKQYLIPKIILKQPKIILKKKLNSKKNLQQVLKNHLMNPRFIKKNSLQQTSLKTGTRTTTPNGSQNTTPQTSLKNGTITATFTDSQNTTPQTYDTYSTYDNGSQTIYTIPTPVLIKVRKTKLIPQKKIIQFKTKRETLVGVLNQKMLHISKTNPWKITNMHLINNWKPPVLMYLRKKILTQQKNRTNRIWRITFCKKFKNKVTKHNYKKQMKKINKNEMILSKPFDIHKNNIKVQIIKPTKKMEKKIRRIAIKNKTYKLALKPLKVQFLHWLKGFKKLRNPNNKLTGLIKQFQEGSKNLNFFFTQQINNKPTILTQNSEILSLSIFKYNYKPKYDYSLAEDYLTHTRLFKPKTGWISKYYFKKNITKILNKAKLQQIIEKKRVALLRRKKDPKKKIANKYWARHQEPYEKQKEFLSWNKILKSHIKKTVKKSAYLYENMLKLLYLRKSIQVFIESTGLVPPKIQIKEPHLAIRNQTFFEKLHAKNVFLRKYTKNPFYINTLKILHLVKTYKNPTLFAEHLAQTLEQTKMHKVLFSTMKDLINLTSLFPQQYIHSMGITITGKIGRKPRTSIERFRLGTKLPLNSFQYPITQALVHSRARIGVFGIRVSLLGVKKVTVSQTFLRRFNVKWTKIYNKYVNKQEIFPIKLEKLAEDKKIQRLELLRSYYTKLRNEKTLIENYYSA